MSTTLVNSTVWQTKLLWVAVALLGAVAFAIVALNRGEAVNAAWLVTAAVCIYFIAFRFYGLFVADRALGVDGARPTPAYRWSRLRSDQSIRALWPSLRGNCRRGSAGGPGTCRANGLSARHAVDPRRRSVRWRGPGHDGPISVDAARWPFAWRYRARRDGTDCRHDRRHRHSHDLRHCACGPCSRCRQGPDRQPVGNVCGLLHDSDCALHGSLQSVHPSWSYR